MTMHLQTIQSQSLSSRQIQSLEILGMGSQELEDYINDSALENPVFDTRDSDRPLDHDDLLNSREWAWQQDVQNHENSLLNIAQTECESTLCDELIGQLRGLKTEPSLFVAARFIIESLDEKGYLIEEELELAAASGFTVNEIKLALKTVQGLDPAGVGARDLSECLCLQLRRLPGNTCLAQTIAMKHLTKLAARQYAPIARDIPCSETEVLQGADLIRSLDPKPGLVFSVQQPLQYIRPDLIITKADEDFEISVSDGSSPSIHINNHYVAMLRTTQDEEVRAYLESKLNSARRLIKCVTQRKNTLIRCVEILVESQKEFFAYGPIALKPLDLSLVAQRMDLHVSTVSRTLKHKYLQCDFGVYPLNYFFVRKLAGMADLSGNRVRYLIGEMIAEEDHHKPYSDREIAEHLSSNGIRISRRTVAKYRNELHIFGAAQRRVIPPALA